MSRATQSTQADRQRRERGEADLRWLMGDARGRRFMWNLLGETGLYAVSFTGNSETFFREGRRSVGLSLHRQLHEVCLESYLEMTAEARASATPEQTSDDDNA